MEENGRVIVKRVERPDGMTEYSLEYMPPIMISDGKYLKEEIRCFRYIQSVKKDFSFLSLNKDVDVIGYFESHGAYKRKECYAAVKTFKEFCNNSCRFGDVSVAFMTAYREYLLKSTKADGRRRYSTNTASGYLKNIKRLLRIAYADHMIDFDPTDEIEGIKWDHTCKRERLTSKEIEAAGIDKHITFHCFRHTFAMQLLDKGVDIPTIAFFLWHKFLGSSLTYLHCTKEHLEEVIAKLEMKNN